MARSRAWGANLRRADDLSEACARIESPLHRFHSRIDCMSNRPLRIDCMSNRPLRWRIGCRNGRLDIQSSDNGRLDIQSSRLRTAKSPARRRFAPQPSDRGILFLALTAHDQRKRCAVAKPQPAPRHRPQAPSRAEDLLPLPLATKSYTLRKFAPQARDRPSPSLPNLLRPRRHPCLNFPKGRICASLVLSTSLARSIL